MPVKSKLRTNERCPIHNSYFCCGRTRRVKEVKELKFRILSDGTKVFPDGREVCPPSILKRRKDRMLEDGEKCIACGEDFNDYSEVELGHKTSKGMNASKRRDNWDNIGPQHKTSNRKMGSMSLESYLSLCKSKGIHPCRG